MRLQPLFTNSFLWRAPTLMFFVTPTKITFLWRAPTLMFFLAPTKITFFGYYWMEAPTSTCTCSNLYRKNNTFFLAPPYHPCFSDLNMFSTICRKRDITMHTNSIMIYFWICLCTLVSLIVFVMDILERIEIPMSFCNPHFEVYPFYHFYLPPFYKC